MAVAITRNHSRSRAMKFMGDRGLLVGGILTHLLYVFLCRAVLGEGLELMWCGRSLAVVRLSTSRYRESALR